MGNAGSGGIMADKIEFGHRSEYARWVTGDVEAAYKRFLKVKGGAKYDMFINKREVTTATHTLTHTDLTCTPPPAMGSQWRCCCC